VTHQTNTIALADFGSFHVGGRLIEIQGREPLDIAFTRTTHYRHDPNGTYRIEAAYVQWFKPVVRICPIPVVLLHGGGMSGTVWETTPDGRPGFLKLLLARGFEVYVVDAVERGRAGWCALDGVWQGPVIQRTLQEAWTLFRIGDAEGFADRTPFSGQRFPVDALEALAASFVPRWVTNSAASVSAFIAALRRIGPSTIVCHSQGAESAFAAERLCPELVRGIVALEPSALPTTAMGKCIPITTVLADFLDATPDWVNLQRRIEQNASERSHHRILSLSDAGLRGHSHLMMFDKGNEAVLDKLVPVLKDYCSEKDLQDNQSPNNRP
jgi:pimeloyl-ACP methyl ester carboxylesterase